jgi:DNA-binding NarL/FixJ family response regulator
MKILVVEDHPIVVSGYQQLFANRTDVTVLNTKNIAGARSLIKKHNPNVVVINENLPDGPGVDFVRKLVAHKPKLRFVIFSMTNDPYLAMRAIDFGAKGFVTKNDTAADLVAAIEAVSLGKIWVPGELIQQIAFARVVGQEEHPRLTRREKNVLNLLVKGRNSSQIATELNISSTLVSTDCATMRRKLNARTIAEMVAIAVRADLRR